MADVLSHSAIPPLGWHGARIIQGTDAAKGVPEILGQLYRTTDLTPNVVYIAMDDLSGWDILFYEGLTGTPSFIGVQTTRTPNQVIANNTNTSVNHTTDTTRYDYGTVKNGTGFAVPVGYGGLWGFSVNVRLGSASSPGAVFIDIQNSVGAGAGVVDFDGAITDPTQDFGITLSGQLELPAGATCNLRVYQNTGNNVTLETYRLGAYLIGVP